MSDPRPELAHGGIASRDGDMATLGDGVRWWLNGVRWARDEADALIVVDRPRVELMARQARLVAYESYRRSSI